MKIELRNAYRAYSLDALAHIERISADPATKIPAIQRNKWVRKDNTFQPTTETTPFAWMLYDRAKKDLHNLPSYLALEKLFESNSELKAQLDSLVGGAGAGSMRRDRFAIFGAVVLQMLHESPQFALSEERADEISAQIVDDLLSDKIVHIRTTPILGLRTEDEITLDDGLSIRPLSDTLTSRFLELGIQIGNRLASPYGDFYHDVTKVAIFLTKPFRKVINPTSTSDVDAKAWHDFASGNVETTVLDTLRIFKSGDIRVAGTITEAQGLFRSGTSYGPLGVHGQVLMSTAYALSKHEHSAFTALYRALKAKSSTPSLSLAVRRFSIAADRQQLDDKLVDYFICAEALFLPDAEDELSFRLAIRAAHFLAEDKAEQRRVFEFFRRAYHARSRIVHGKTLKNLKDSSGKIVPLGQFVGELEGYLRKAISEILLSKRFSGIPAKSEWDQLLFN